MSENLYKNVQTPSELWRQIQSDLDSRFEGAPKIGNNPDFLPDAIEAAFRICTKFRLGPVPEKLHDLKNWCITEQRKVDMALGWEAARKRGVDLGPATAMTVLNMPATVSADDKTKIIRKKFLTEETVVRNPVLSGDEQVMCGDEPVVHDTLVNCQKYPVIEEDVFQNTEQPNVGAELEAVGKDLAEKSHQSEPNHKKKKLILRHLSNSGEAGGGGSRKIPFKFSAGQVFYKNKKLPIPIGRAMDVLKKIVRTFPNIAKFRALDKQSAMKASDQLRGYILKINTTFKKAKVPYTIKAERSKGYLLTPKK